MDRQRRGVFSPLVLLLGLAVATPGAARAEGECVVLLHGLARSAKSMAPVARRLTQEGYEVVNQAYPSRRYPIEVLAERYVAEGASECERRGGQRIHFVTHSLGGILVRKFLQTHTLHALGRTVMIGPPNQGSEVVDNWKGVPGFRQLNGPAGDQLGTDDSSTPRQLGPVDYPVGVIAGTRTINPLLSLSLPNPDDGKVSVQSTKVPGMSDHLEVPHSHPFLMRPSSVHDQIVYFLRHGKFLREEDS